MAKKEISRPQTANITPFGLRLQPDLKERVEFSAKENGRSMNAEIVNILQEHFRELDEGVEQLRQGIEAENREGVSLGLADARDRVAILKVLLLQELMLLKSRVGQLGGRDAVLSATKAELAKKIDGPRIRGTTEEQKSYFSRMVEQTPLTAILTTKEIDQLARRMVELQRSHPANSSLVSATENNKSA